MISYAKLKVYLCTVVVPNFVKLINKCFMSHAYVFYWKSVAVGFYLLKLKSCKKLYVFFVLQNAECHFRVKRFNSIFL